MFRSPVASYDNRLEMRGTPLLQCNSESKPNSNTELVCIEAAPIARISPERCFNALHDEVAPHKRQRLLCLRKQRHNTVGVRQLTRTEYPEVSSRSTAQQHFSVRRAQPL